MIAEFFNQDVFIILYCALILFTNISYLREHKSIKEELEGMTTEDVEFNTESFSIVFLSLVFSFLRSWLIYFIAYHVTGYVVIFLIVAVFIIMDGYHSIFNHRVETLRKSRIPFIRIGFDTVFISLFLIYYCTLFIS